LSRKRVVVLARQATLAGGNETLESILELLQSLKFGLRSVSWAKGGGGGGGGVSRLGPTRRQIAPFNFLLKHRLFKKFKPPTASHRS
jgi:hypothetical protein